MTDGEIRDIFEVFFEIYKKTEGDRSAWSAFWVHYGPAGRFEINMTKCPRGTVFKPFADGAKLPEIVGWEVFLAALSRLEDNHPGLFGREAFFQEMREAI